MNVAVDMLLRVVVIHTADLHAAVIRVTYVFNSHRYTY